MNFQRPEGFGTALTFQEGNVIRRQREITAPEEKPPYWKEAAILNIQTMSKQKVFQERFAAGVKQAALLAIISLALGVSFQAVRSDKIPWVGSWTTLSVTTQSLQGVADISLSEAFALYRDNRAFFLDARDPWSFKEGHLAGAVLIEPPDAGKQVSEIRKRAGSRQIIAYCDGAECHLGVDLAKALEKQGISSVKVLINGWSRWREAGYPIEKGNP